MIFRADVDEAAGRIAGFVRRTPVMQLDPATFAALHAGAYVPSAGECVAVILCGSNTDPATL